MTLNLTLLALTLTLTRCAVDATLLRKTAAAAALGLGHFAVQGNAKQPLVQ